MEENQQSAQSGQDDGDWITGAVFQLDGAESSLGYGEVPSDCFPEQDDVS